MLIHEKIKLTLDDGQVVDAIAPVIISASRATDIPAFFADWFIKRFEKGYFVWINPFNHQRYYVSCKNCKAIVFWSKNPKPLIKYLPYFDNKNIAYYFQFTLNDYEKEHFEKNVPSIVDRINTFKELSNLIGKDRVIWRYDPLILHEGLSVRDLIVRVFNIGQELKAYTNKLVFSFVDVKDYKKVARNLINESSFYNKDNVLKAEFSKEQRLEAVFYIAKCRDKWQQEGFDITFATCAESEDYSKFGIVHNSCIDAKLLLRLCPLDKYFNCDLNEALDFRKLKDKGQRKECLCALSKDIGLYNTCRHFCVYCYANTSIGTVENNWEKIKFNNN